LRRQTIIYEYDILQWLAFGLDTPHARFILVTILTIELESGSPNAAICWSFGEQKRNIGKQFLPRIYSMSGIVLEGYKRTCNDPDRSADRQLYSTTWATTELAVNAVNE
jgi:hypothetical protein